MPFVSPEYLSNMGDDKREWFARAALMLGTHPTTNDNMLLFDRDRYAGTYILGVQGVGKSALLENMISFDHEAGNAVIVIDPHGDLIAHCLAHLPAHRLSQTYLLDMEDAEAWPFGINVYAAGKLETSIAATQAVERIMHIFEVLWPDVLSQQGLSRYLRAATITLLSNPGATLVNMYSFLLDDQVRKRMLQHVTEPTVRQFWQTQYDDLRETERMRRVQPLIGRLESLFMGRSLVRNIVGQRKSTINFRKAIENREAIFIKLPINTLGHDARLIGTMIMAQIHAAVFSFANVPESERPGVSLYIDEFQVFSTRDIDELFTQGRKYGMKLTVAHQYRNQLPSFLQDSTMTARTKVVFRTTPDDGRSMAAVFPAQEAIIKPEDIEPHAIDRLLTYGHDNPIVRTFIETYLRPMQSHKKSNYIEVKDTGFSPMDMWYGTRPSDVRAPDPTPYLDSLLYRVMQTGDPSLPIPLGAVKGFANCGVGFYSVVRGLYESDDRLSGTVRYPRALVVANSKGEPHWTRWPENGHEQFYHLIFHLRETMVILAEEPVGKKSTPNTSNVAQMLMALPKRAAFVRSGEDVGVIYTNPTPIVDGDVAEKIRIIQAQTRDKYCHPRAEVEAMLVHTASPKAQNSATPQATHPVPDKEAALLPPIPRWEEL